MTTLSRRSFVKHGMLAGGLLAAGPLGALSTTATARTRATSPGYGPLVDKGDLWLPADFDYQVISAQGRPMSDGTPTPGMFDAMGAYPGPGGTTILIRNHENRERPGELKVNAGAALEYNQACFGGCTKLVVRRRPAGRDRKTGLRLYTYEIERDFAILGGTSTNCAGGRRGSDIWLTCEEVVKRAGGIKHGYVFEVDVRADGPVKATPIPQAGRMSHEAALQLGGIVYLTEDTDLAPDPVLGTSGACFYRYVPAQRSTRVPLAQTTGMLEALKIKGEHHANMDGGRVVGKPYPVEWVPVPEPDHDDDTDSRTDRVPGLTPTRIQAQDRGAAYFDRQEGMWATRGEVYFDCTTGGPADLGQVWKYDPARETLTLIYESADPARLQNPDNVVVVPTTRDIFLCEDSDAEQYVRGVTQDGRIYDFAKTAANESEFCGACFDVDGGTLYLNQQGSRGTLPGGPPNGGAVTYAIYGPFERRAALSPRPART